MYITKEHLLQWKENSLRIARKLGYDQSVLDFLEEKLLLEVNSRKIPSGMWYGWAHYDRKSPFIEVYQRNISCQSVPEIVDDLRSKGVPEKTIKRVKAFLLIVPRRVFFMAFNQSGMDHELIGHLFNYLAKRDHGEEAAVKVQIEFAKARRGLLFHKLPWTIIAYFAPIILYHHKKDEF